MARIMEAAMNVNDKVFVKLTPDGQKTYDAWIDFTCKPLLSIYPEAESIERRNNDAGDQKTFTLWQFMLIFGTEMCVGGRDQFVDGRVTVETENKWGNYK